MKIIITGGAGFIGSHTAILASKQRHEVLVLDDFSTGRVGNISNEFGGDFATADVFDIKSLEPHFSKFKPDTVIHLAAQSAITTSMKDPKKDLGINTVGTLNVLRMCQKYNVQKIVFSSTSAVYKKGKPLFGGVQEGWPLEPDSPYGVSKLAAEQYVRLSGVEFVIFRYGNVYGPKQIAVGENQVIARAMNHLINRRDFKVNGSGKQKRDFVYVEDVARLNLEAVAYPYLNGTFNLCTGQSHSVNEALTYIEECHRQGWYNWKHTTIEDERGSVFISNKKIKESFLTPSFLPFREGIKRTYDWWMDSRGVE